MAFFPALRILSCLALGLSLTGIPGVALPALAQELEGDALEQLALRGVWQAEHAEYGLWDWSDSGSVCLRIGSADEDCADTGSWEISDNVICYELSWWGDTVGERVNCFTVSALGDDRYETLFHGGAMVSRMFAFRVLE